MIEVHQDIYAKLGEAAAAYEVATGTAVAVYHQRPEILDSFPTITYRVENNIPIHSLDKSDGFRETTVAVEIYANQLSQSEAILEYIITSMLELDYVLSFNRDIIDPDGGSHLSTQFSY